MRNVSRLALGVIASALSVVPMYLIIGIFDGGLENDFLVPALLIAPQIALVGVVLVGLPALHLHDRLPSRFLQWQDPRRKLVVKLA